MTIIQEITEELARYPESRPCCRITEAAVMLRFAGGLYLDGGQVIAEAQLEEHAAQRLAAIIADVFALQAHCHDLPRPGPARPARSVVRVSDGETLARRAGLMGNRGRLVLGLPPQAVRGSLCDSAALWRGALLASGSASGNVLAVTCPGWEAGMAMTGAARRLGMQARARTMRGTEQVITKGQAAVSLLARIGAHQAAIGWETSVARQEQARASARAANSRPAGDGRIANLDGANAGRSALAGQVAAARAERALQILGDSAPSHLAAAARARLADRTASLERAGQMADPPLSKDAIAGRIRRLIAAADRRAAELGIPGTGAQLLPEPA